MVYSVGNRNEWHRLGRGWFFHSILDDICSCNVHGRWKFYFSSCCGTTCQWVSAHKATGIGIFSVGGNIGFGVAPLIAAAAMTTFQSPGTGVFAVMGIIMAALMLWAIPASLAKLRHQHVSQQLNQCAYNEQKNDWPAFARLSIVILFRSVATTSTLAFIPLFCIQQFGISEAMSSTLLTFLCLCGAYMTAFGGWLTDRVGLIRACRLGYILMAPAFALFFGCANNLVGISPFSTCEFYPEWHLCCVCRTRAVLSSHKILAHGIRSHYGVGFKLRRYFCSCTWCGCRQLWHRCCDVCFDCDWSVLCCRLFVAN